MKQFFWSAFAVLSLLNISHAVIGMMEPPLANTQPATPVSAPVEPQRPVASLNRAIRS